MRKKSQLANWKARALRPVGLDLRPTTIGMKEKHDITPFVYDDSPFLSAFFIGFVAMIPEGERIMVSAVRHYREEIRQLHPQLYEECRVFCGQEAHHSNETMILNNSLAHAGVPMSEIYAFVDKLSVYVKSLPMIDQMAFTGAAEIFTALMGDMVLRNPELLEKLDSYAAINLTWHLMEEIAHKAVTHDLLEAVDGTQWKRLYGYSIAVSCASLVILYTMYVMRRQFKHEFTFLDTGKGLWWMFGFGQKAGYLRKIIPRSINSLRPAFHPWSEDNAYLIHEGMHWLEKQMANEHEKGAGSAIRNKKVTVLGAMVA